MSQNKNDIKYAAVLDFETTHLIPNKGKIIEAAVCLVELDDNRNFGKVVETFSSFNDPEEPIPATVTKLTGITDDMVKGHKLDWKKFNDILFKSSVLISHNARFDRAWLEEHGAYKTNWWACTLDMIDWKQVHDMPCRTLKHLAWEHGFFPNAHRALDDTETLVKLLSSKSKSNPERTYAQELLTCAATKRRILFATYSPFDKKDLLKEKQFKWSSERKTWWKVVLETELEELKTYLDQEVYSGHPRYEITEPVDSLAPQFGSKYGIF